MAAWRHRGMASRPPLIPDCLRTVSIRSAGPGSAQWLAT
jgi:hypothetical protein